MATALPIVYDGVRQPELDIVSIPGLPDLVPHYRLKDHTKWLREVLSHAIPKARIMAFQYDFAKADPVTSWGALLDHVMTLLWSLAFRRGDDDKRPLVFVCYSFGAFILKKALLEAKNLSKFRGIVDSTVGIVFLGCLHDESHPDLQDICLKTAAVEFNTTKTKHDAVESLRSAKGWDILREVMESFRYLRPNFQVRGFFELRPTVLPSGRWKFKKSQYLCPEPLSSLGWDTERLIGVDLDHSQLTSYPHRTDEEFYDVFLNTLSDLVNEVCPNMPEFPRSGESPELSENWSDVHGALAASTASLSVESAADRMDFDPHLRRGLEPQPISKVKIPCYVTKPYEENPEFVGRLEVLDTIHTALLPQRNGVSAQRVFALTGLGGVGKTQTAVKYAFAHRDTYKVVLWAHADGQSKLAESFCVFAEELGLCGVGTVNSNVAKQLVKDALQHMSDNWLMVFDNADGEDNRILLREFWPAKNRGSILITSRDTVLSAEFPGEELTVLDEDSAVKLLRSLTRFDAKGYSGQTLSEELEAAKAIVKKIDYLPLGIWQASMLIINNRSLFTEFLEAYGHRELIEDFSEVQLVSHGSIYRYSLATVWNMTFEQLAEGPKSMMKVISFLDPDRIQMRLLNEGAQKTNEESLSFMDSPHKRSKHKGALLKSGLVTQNEVLKELRMHRLVAASCHYRMSLEERQSSFRDATILVKNCWPVPARTAIHNPSLWEDQQAFLPHVQTLCAHYVASCQRNEPLIPHDSVNWDFASVLYEAGWFCYERGLLDSVNDLLRPAEEYCLRHLEKGNGYRLLADIYGGLGSLCTESNQFQGAYDDFNKQWTYLQLAFDHGELERPSIWEVFGLGRLANGFHGLQNYEQAELYYRKCLKAWEDLPGDQKIFTTHLATCLWLQGRPDEGEQILLGIIKDRNDTSNFRTGMALFSLGNIQISQATRLTADGKKTEALSRFKEAMETHVQAHKLYHITLGPWHHKTADALHKVGWHLHRENDYVAALKNLEAAMEIYEGTPHLFKNEIARTTYKMGCIHQDMGDMVKGREEIRVAEKMRQEIVLAENWAPAQGEEDFDDIVQFWTR